MSDISFPSSLSDIDRLRHFVGQASRSVVLLTALGLALRARLEPEPQDPQVLAAADHLLARNGLEGAVAGAAKDELLPVLALIRAEMLFGGDVLGEGRAGNGWQDRDPAILQAFGAVSLGFWRGFEQLARAVDPALLDRLDAPGARFLDIGSGVGWLSIGMLRRWPHLHAVGIEPLPGALALARRNLAEAGLADRMELREGLGEGLQDLGTYDLIFVPSAFIPSAALPDILARGHAALRPGGRLLLAAIAPSDIDDGAAVARFRAAIWGGSVLGVEGGKERLHDAGFDRIDLHRQPGGFIAFLLADAETGEALSAQTVPAQDQTADQGRNAKGGHGNAEHGGDRNRQTGRNDDQ